MAFWRREFNARDAIDAKDASVGYFVFLTGLIRRRFQLWRDRQDLQEILNHPGSGPGQAPKGRATKEKYLENLRASSSLRGKK